MHKKSNLSARIGTSISSRLKLSKTFVLISTALCISSPLVAEETANEDESLNKVVITGTRIKSVNQESASPVSSIDSESIAYTGKTRIKEIVSELGALVGTQDDDKTSNGESYLNLRNLGVNRTLTLVDGHRFVSGNGASAVDTNAIPLAMIERVDVLTGGASAIYGADAVTGVVNFVLKKDFEGVSFNAQYGDAFDGDFQDQQFSLTAGKNFANGLGNITASYTYGHRPAVLASARPEASTELYERINNPNGDIPEFILATGTNESFFTNGGARIDPFQIFSDGFNGDGTPFEHGQNIGSFAGTGEIGGDGIPNYILFAYGIRPKNDRNVLSINTNYEVSEQFRPFININYSDVSTGSLSQHSLTVGSQVARDNAFLPASVLNAAGPNGGPPIFFNRWDLDVGFNELNVNKKTYRILLGANGEITDNIEYDIALNLGESERVERSPQNRMFDRYLAAIDAVDDGDGNIVCRSNLDPASFNSLAGDFIVTSFNPADGAATFIPGANSGCTPFNPFTTDNSLNQAAIDWIWQPTMNTLDTEQTVISAYLSGDFASFAELQGGSIEFVLGAEHREEKTKARYDEFSGSDRVVAFNSGSDLSGKFDVTEMFAEVSLPIFRDHGTMMNALTVDAAFRSSDYSTIGSTETWKLGAVWEPTANFSLRSTVSEAVRAPNIGELFTAQTNISISLGEDPCHIDNINLGSDTRAANCAAELNAIGVDPTTFEPLLGTFFPGLTGGSPDLKEEKASTQTIGFLWQPQFLEELTLSLDYYDIEITDAVITPDQTAMFNACYDSETLDNVFCSLIGRDSTTGAANFVELQAVNVARIETAGYEFSGSYRFETANAGRFNFTLNSTYLDKLNVQKTELPVLTDDKGLFNTSAGGSSAEWVTSFDLNWRYGDWDANYGYNYISKTLRSPLINEQRDIAHEIIDEPYVKAFTNHDLQVGYSFSSVDARVYFGIRNLTDEYPDKIRASLNGPSGKQSYAGRSYYIGVNWNY